MENMNSVCFVGKIESINEIENCDRIVQAIISNWECVIQKDKYSVGDLVVIATTDAIIPFELAEKLGVVNYLKNRKKTNQYTVRTTKFRGVYSSALIISNDTRGLKEGTDCMEIYNIYKYEEPAVQLTLSSGKRVRYHKNPNFHVYYKFPNAKNAPGMFTEEDDVVITNKIHGTNVRYGIVKKPKLSLKDKIKRLFGNKWIEYDFVYGSHNVEKGSESQGFYSTDVWRTVGDDINIKEILWKNFKRIHSYGNRKEGMILHGEIYGKGIQKYYDYGFGNLQVAFFDVEIDGKYLCNEDFRDMMDYMGLPRVPVLYKGKFNEDKVKELQNDRFIEGTKIPEEGCVVKHISGDRAKIAKYINPAYLEFQSKKEDSTDFH